jgi:SAM-dependent methyltransferase
MKLFQAVESRVRRAYRKAFPHPVPDYSRYWHDHCQKWVLGSAHVQDGNLLITGWLALDSARRGKVDFRLNGEPFDHVQFPLPRPDVAELLPFIADQARQSGFLLWKNWPHESADRQDWSLQAVNGQTGQPLGADVPDLFSPAAYRVGPIPQEVNRRRVIGDSTLFSYTYGGYTAFRQLDEAIFAESGERLGDFPRMLDWGCGCARLSRYILALPGVQLTGVDVDPDNIAWCQANFPQSRWQTIALRPPTPFANASFDLAVGLSVFTHLKEPDQNLWLAELQRVIRPGGWALMTIHGEGSIAWSRLSGERFHVLNRDGICDQLNPIYDAQLAETDYYRDTFHTEEYLRRVWAKYFRIASIRRCCVTHQDLVLMQRP